MLLSRCSLPVRSTRIKRIGRTYRPSLFCTLPAAFCNSSSFSLAAASACFQSARLSLIRLMGSLIICSSRSAPPVTLTSTLLMYSRPLLGVAESSRMNRGLNPQSVWKAMSE